MSQCSAEDLATLETSGIMDELRTMQTAMNYVCVEHIDGKNSRAAYSVYARGDNGSAGRGSWVMGHGSCGSRGQLNDWSRGSQATKCVTARIMCTWCCCCCCYGIVVVT